MRRWVTVSMCHICWLRGVLVLRTQHGSVRGHGFERLRIDVQEYTAA